MYIKNKNAVVVGGVSGIGLACVKEMLKSGVGKIVVLDYNSAAFDQLSCEIESEFGCRQKVMFVKADVVYLQELEQGFRKAKDIMKSIDIVVNNAGIANEDVWSQMIDINFKGSIRGTQLGLQYLGLNHGGKGGVIINTGSIFGLTPTHVLPVYEGAKAGLIAYTRSMATPESFKLTGVRLLTMCPGFTDTDILKGEDVYIPLTEEQIETVQKATLGSVKQRPEEVAQGIVYAIKHGCNGAVFMTFEGSTYELDMITDLNQIPKTQVL